MVGRLNLEYFRLFFEELRMISRALRQIGPEEVTDEDLSEIMPAVDQITLTLQKIARRKERKEVARIQRVGL
jgi:phosphoenolpyruvate carboxylase